MHKETVDQANGTAESSLCSSRSTLAALNNVHSFSCVDADFVIAKRIGRLTRSVHVGVDWDWSRGGRERLDEVADFLAYVRGGLCSEVKDVSKSPTES